MNFVIPSHYGNTETTLTGKQQNVSKGLDVVGQGLTQFFNWKTQQAGGQIQPSQGAGYYDPSSQPPSKPNYTPVIIISALLGTIVIGGIVYMNTKGKKK
jgi:hypothetical protein